jgi:hypothetical protein
MEPVAAAVVSVVVLGIVIVAVCAAASSAARPSNSPVGGDAGSTIAPTRPPARARATYYRTKDGRGDFGFTIQQLGGGEYRVYITSYPTEAARCRALHRLSDGHGAYICWSAPLRTEDEARRVAAAWADRVQDYLRTGRGF